MNEDFGSNETTNHVVLPEEVQQQLEAEKKINSNVMCIRLTSDGLIIKDNGSENSTLKNANLSEEDAFSLLSGVYCQGVQYYDLRGVKYINNTGMSILIALLKSLLEMNVEVQFVNVHKDIRNKIKAMGLEQIIKCEERNKN